MQWHDNNLIHDISQYGKLFLRNQISTKWPLNDIDDCEAQQTVYEFRSERMYNLSTYTTYDLDMEVEM